MYAVRECCPVHVSPSDYLPAGQRWPSPTNNRHYAYNSLLRSSGRYEKRGKRPEHRSTHTAPAAPRPTTPPLDLKSRLYFPAHLTHTMPATIAHSPPPCLHTPALAHTGRIHRGVISVIAHRCLHANAATGCGCGVGALDGVRGCVLALLAASAVLPASIRVTHMHAAHPAGRHHPRGVHLHPLPRVSEQATAGAPGGRAGPPAGGGMPPGSPPASSLRTRCECIPASRTRCRGWSSRGAP